MLTDYNVAGVPDLTVDQLARILRDAQSPATPEAVHIHAALKATGVRPSVWLGFFFVESKMGTVGIVKDFDTKNAGNVRAPESAALGTVIDTPRGKFAKYATWADGAFDWGKRLTGPKYAGKGLTTVRQVLPKYAPSGDQDNSPTAYIKAVLDSIEEWTRQSGTGGARVAMLQQPPMDKSHQSPNKNGYSGKRRVDAVVWHVTAGSFGGSLGWLTNPASGASANYLLDKDGSIYELVPPDQDAWANGAVAKPDTSNPLIPKWQAEGVNFNQRTVSIETAQEHSANEQPGGFTEAQHKTLVRLTAWLCQTYHLTPDRTHIFGHRTIDSVNRPHCPGLAESEWDAWVGEIAALVGGTTPPSAMLEPVVTERTDWGGKGRVVAQTVTVVNDDQGKYYERKIEHRATGPVMLDWKEV